MIQLGIVDESFFGKIDFGLSSKER